MLPEIRFVDNPVLMWYQNGVVDRALEALYAKAMGTGTNFDEGLFTVRSWDGMDGCWTDCLANVSGEEALRYWASRTENGTKQISYEEIDYYRIFPADTKMHWNGGEGREMFR